MRKPDTITKQLIGYDTSIDGEPVYLTINWDEEEWSVHTELDNWMGYASGGGTDSEAADYLQFYVLDESWFSPVD